YVLGRRQDTVFLQLKALLAPFGITRFYTDGWDAYERHVDSEKHTVGKAHTQKIESKQASFISRITALCNCVPPLLWLMCRNNPTRGGTDRHEIHATARYRHCSPRPHCRASVSEPGSI